MTTENLIRDEFRMSVISDTFTYGLSESYLFSVFPFTHPIKNHGLVISFLPV